MMHSDVLFDTLFFDTDYGETIHSGRKFNFNNEYQPKRVIAANFPVLLDEVKGKQNEI